MLRSVSFEQVWIMRYDPTLQGVLCLTLVACVCVYYLCGALLCVCVCADHVMWPFDGVVCGCENRRVKVDRWPVIAITKATWSKDEKDAVLTMLYMNVSAHRHSTSLITLLAYASYITPPAYASCITPLP